jgi:formamidopyrimidine-DNA glycosylase
MDGMPELPELEAFVLAHRDALTADPVDAVPVAHFATVKTIEPPLSSLAGARFTDVRRRAKRLLLPSETGHTVMLHLMSAGKLVVGETRPKSAVLALRFASGLHLAMTEGGTKRRAAAWLLRPAEVEAELAHLGPEPLDPDFTPARLREALATPHRLHAFLRDQRLIAGVGRAYANEILHAARLSPYASTTALDDEELDRLHAAIVGTLGAGVERLRPASGKGLAPKSAQRYAVHDRLGDACPRCGDAIRRVSFAEHTVFYCATCQTGGRVLADRRLSRLLRN